MYRPPVFREDRPDILHAAIRSHPLATLVTHGAAGLTANLVPFTLAILQGDRAVLRAHLARANTQLADLRNGAEALVIFQGPQAYITPSWYPTKQEHGKVVPTWNYVVVQAWGRPQVIDDAEWLLAQIGDLTTQQEQRQNAPWSVDDAPTAYIAGQLKGISGLEIPIDRIEGKWKASQNQPAANRAGVISGLRAQDPASPMATLMDQWDKPA
ncbi:transcriptional regulator [Sphingomonas oleivorans]|uniref:Transcriptional regulator n=1 Tax=Sphingomonas oleivorans TaxID=1735121 RepID=A0A2T5FZW7_9SPHN|nr:FMN-binding negative transcriptional regulator [Sphingomonas oleivorans]PTQ12228.1 transcriptional regulator [Sphingomonas oleivorans]